MADDKPPVPVECPLCGAAVLNEDRHADWHHKNTVRLAAVLRQTDAHRVRY